MSASTYACSTSLYSLTFEPLHNIFPQENKWDT